MKYVLVTGAAGGVGRATTEALRLAGYGVVATDVLSAQQWRENFGEESNTPYFPADMSRADSILALRSSVQSLGVELQGLALCAGIAHSQPLLETSLESWQQLHAVNSTGVFLVIREFAQLMIEQNPKDSTNARGIVTVSSNASHTPRAEFGAYGASKASASSVSLSFGLQLAQYGIRVNTVCPGTTRTPMITDAWRGEDLSHQPVEGNSKNFRLGIPLGRIADPEDIAAVIEFLVDSRSRHMTMQELTVDGGATF
ncbi:SDR family oxidoreductase [Rothia terrae]|uniref:SDR family oxidoreductase n=1 Tax=Rothia terrae TaxID=396015 RepID=UPI0033F89996